MYSIVAYIFTFFFIKIDIMTATTIIEILLKINLSYLCDLTKKKNKRAELSIARKV